MTDCAIACLISSNFEATAKFYRYFGFEIVSQDDTAMRLARGPVELMFMWHDGPLPRDEDRIAVFMVDDVAAWREYFSQTRMSWKSMGRPGLTRISTGAWTVPAFNVSDRDGNVIWV